MWYFRFCVYDNGVLKATGDVIIELKQKHPEPAEILQNVLINGPIEFVPTNYFASIDESSIQKAAKLTKGAAGPSQFDADQFHRILCSKKFKNEGKTLREQIVILARNIATSIIDPSCLEAFVACRLIPLNKNPGVRPIGVGEILRRIIGKAIGWVLNSDIQEAAGPLQASAGLKGGAEAAIHVMRDIFNEESTDGVILVDASNAFNSLNRQVALHNIQYICPPFATVLINTYRMSSRLFVTGGREISSQEGTTQGDNLAMAFYGLATKPLLEQLKIRVNKIKQVWFADDATGAGGLHSLKEWWDLAIELGKKIGYYVNESKSWLILKDANNLELAKSIFKGTSIKFTVSGKQHLGAVIGSESFKSEYIKENVQTWCNEILKLSEIAKSQPQAALSAYIHGEQHRFTYFLRTIEGIEDYLMPLDNIITHTFIPAILGSTISDTERELFALPIRNGGLGIQRLTEKAATEYEISHTITAPLVAIMAIQGDTLPDNKNHNATKAKIIQQKQQHLKQKIEIIDKKLSPETLRVLEQTRSQGASNWLNVLPLAEHGFNLHKREFRDALALRYNKPLRGLPSHCPCGQKFTINHAMNCKRGGFVIIRHNNIRDYESSLLSKVSNDVQTEPEVQPLTGEQLNRCTIKGYEARLDIRARGFWRRGQNPYFDVRITNANSESVKTTSVGNVLSKHEREKKNGHITNEL